MGFVYPLRHHLEGLKNPLFRKKKRELLEQKGLLKNIPVPPWSCHNTLFDMVAKSLLPLYCDSVSKLLV